MEAHDKEWVNDMIKLEIDSAIQKERDRISVNAE